MWRVRSLPRLQAGCFSLEAQAGSAGLALACVYSSSDEYEASVIAQRRDAGAYGHNQRHVILVAVAAAAALLFFISL